MACRAPPMNVECCSGRSFAADSMQAKVAGKQPAASPAGQGTGLTARSAAGVQQPRAGGAVPPQAWRVPAPGAHLQSRSPQQTPGSGPSPSPCREASVAPPSAPAVPALAAGMCPAPGQLQPSAQHQPHLPGAGPAASPPHPAGRALPHLKNATGHKARAGIWPAASCSLPACLDFYPGPCSSLHTTVEVANAGDMLKYPRSSRLPASQPPAGPSRAEEL